MERKSSHWWKTRKHVARRIDVVVENMWHPAEIYEEEEVFEVFDLENMWHPAEIYEEEEVFDHEAVDPQEEVFDHEAVDPQEEVFDHEAVDPRENNEEKGGRKKKVQPKIELDFNCKTNCRHCGLINKLRNGGLAAFV
ncbi:uncharacterized protein LOC144652733 isoform X4 [Oculina patagonica]